MEIRFQSRLKNENPFACLKTISGEKGAKLNIILKAWCKLQIYFVHLSVGLRFKGLEGLEG